MKLGGYTVEDVISESPAAVVYRVRHPKLKSVHACKVVPPSISQIPSVRSFFLQRMQWYSEHQTPFCIRVTDVVETDAALGFVMDWLEGEALHSHLSRYQRVELQFAVRWTVQILSALHVFHQAQIEHLDITPKNIFLHRSEKGVMAILMDASMRVNIQSDVLQMPSTLFHQKYRSPEQIDGKAPIGLATDVYQVGVLLYQMLTGRCPFDGDTEYSVMHAIQGGRFQSLKSSGIDLPEALIDIVHKAMSKDPAQRFQSAKEMIDAIHATIALPDIEEPIAFQATEPEEVIVDVLIEEDGEWVLQYSEENRVQQERSQTEQTKSSGMFSSFRRPDFLQGYPAWFWRIRVAFFSLLFCATALWSLWMGGLFSGRRTEIQIAAIPDWGSTKVQLDEQSISLQTHEEQLPLGHHQVDVEGGVATSGGCGRCCWSHRMNFYVPFGWGALSQTIDVSSSVDTVTCPTVEQGYLFEKVNILDGMMGAPPDFPYRSDNSIWHHVQLLQSFWMGKTEVTEELYQQVMGGRSKRFVSKAQKEDGRLPKRQVSWMEAIQFCNLLSQKEGLETCYQIDSKGVHWEKGSACTGYRLPTEAEWELSARAGMSLIMDGKYYWYAGGSNASLLAWYARNSQQRVQRVGSKFPNALGLYDMSGNVSEWVWDGYSPYLGDAINPKGVDSSLKVVRGGHYVSTENQIRVFDRSYADQGFQSERIGFRIVRSIGQ